MRVLLFLLLFYLPLSAEYVHSKKSLQHIQQGMDKILNKIDQNVHVGIEVVSLETKQRLYEKNAHKLFVPASTTKLFVAGAALSTLGPHFTFETSLLTDGPVKDHTIRGNVYLQGSGDPSFTLNDLEQMVLILRLSQVKEIQGDLIVDHFAFDSFPEGPGWMWDDIHSVSYSPMNALSINHNCLNVWVRPADKVATPPRVFAYPKTGYVKIENHATTGEKEEIPSLGRVLRMKRNTIQVKGEIGIRSDIQSFQIPIEGPHLYAVTLLHSVLKKAGIEWKGKMRVQKAPTHAAVLASHRSAPLSVLLHNTLKKSDNLYADNLFKKVGQIHFEEQGTWKNGSKAVRHHLEQEAGLAISDLVLVDGSGLSRYNLASPHHFTSYLSWLYNHFPYSAELLSALSLAGKDGILKSRFAPNPPNLRAKSGTMAGISTLSGYLQTADGEPLAFSIMINGFTEKAAFYKADVEDPICTFLAKLSRNE